MSSRLASLVRGPRTAGADAPAATAEEVCDLCSAPVREDHRHLVDLHSGRLLCACRACMLLFEGDAAGGDHYKLIGTRRVTLEDFALDDATWDELRIPVDIAFFVDDSRAGRVVARYPSPMGPTESLLRLESWERIVGANPVLEGLVPDVEALLVHRARGARAHWIVPLDDCYSLVGLIRTHWKGFGGGDDVWRRIDDFFTRLTEAT